ncbi:hypothetical protein WHR41_00033 [Cladosporium halotolerans]|uniref:Apple domain-containing protein n=1 Tax=Cladosporium halotolerans TaxID=1052096 RepID=A0AB34L8G4_9PEZI
MDYTGGSYRVLCDYEYPAGSEIRTISSPGFADCSDDCTELPECTAFSYTNNVCTFLRGYGTPPTGATRNGTSTFVLLSKRAVRVVNGSTIYDTSTPGTVPPYSTSRSLRPGTRTGSSVTGSTMPTSVSIPSISVNTAITSVTGVGSAVSSALSGVTGLTSLLTLPSTSATQVFVGSSALVATSQGPTQTPVAYMCPAQDGQVLVENGQSYVLNCNSSTSGTHYSTRQAATSFNDCFRECDQSSTNEGARYCTAFTYEGPSNGQGSGTCYLYNGVTQGFTASTGTRSISAIRAVNYAPAAGGGAASSALSGLTGLTTPFPSTSLTLSLSVPTASVTSVAPNVNVDLTGTLGASLSVGLGLGLSASLGSSGLGLGLNPTLGAGVGAGLGLGGGGGGGAASTSNYVTPLAPVLTTTITVTPTPTFTTTTVLTTSTVTSCLTGAGGVLTCPIGGLFTTLPSTSGAVTSISTSVSVSISYVTVTTTGTSSSRTVSTFSTRTSSSSSQAPTGACLGVIINGNCIV